jgi:NAD(P)-dependent dehydrogenase (short-subunit alcohol dehydrogenase family)
VVAAGRRAPDGMLPEGMLPEGMLPEGMLPEGTLPEGQDFLALDVRDPASVRAGFAAIIARHGRLDALVNNAGVTAPDMLDPDDHAAWHDIMATNLHGAYYCAKAALPLLADGSGRIVTVASVLGLRGVADQAGYVAAKHGVIGLTRALALAAAPRGITVNAVCPGWVDTDMATDRLAQLGIGRAQAMAGVPTGRMVAPEEVAGLIAFLLRPESASLTGLALPIDGGSLALP